MNFPAQFLIRAVNAKTRAPVPHLAIKLILFAPAKNNYTIPIITDASGNAAITKEHVLRSIEDDWNLFPMDYASSLEECSPEIEIRTCSADDVRKTVDAFNLFGPTRTTSSGLRLAFENSVNDQYSPTSKRINVEQVNPFEIEILPK